MWGNVHPLASPDILKRWIMCIFEKMTSAYVWQLLEKGGVFQNSLKKTPCPPAGPLFSKFAGIGWGHLFQKCTESFLQNIRIS